MDQRLRPSSLVPEGFVVEHATIDGERVTVSVRTVTGECACPACGAVSRRIQSRYWRRVADLPLAGRRVDLLVTPLTIMRGQSLLWSQDFAIDAGLTIRQVSFYKMVRSTLSCQ